MTAVFGYRRNNSKRFVWAQPFGAVKLRWFSTAMRWSPTLVEVTPMPYSTN